MALDNVRSNKFRSFGSSWALSWRHGRDRRARFSPRAGHHFNIEEYGTVISMFSFNTGPRTSPIELSVCASL
jgi:hypothetical protein